MEYQHLDYKRNAAEIVKRLTALWTRKAIDQLFAHIEITTQALREFAAKNQDGPVDAPNPSERIRFWDAHLAELRDVEDDWMPFAYLSEFDQGIYGGALGVPMQFMMHKDIGWISSMVPPMLDDLDKINDLIIDANTGAIRLLDSFLEVYTKEALGKFGVAPFITIDAMNFVSEVRGATQAYIDCIDSPNEVIRMMDFALDLNIFIQDRVHRKTQGYAGGSFVNMASWAPGTPVLLSVDAYHLAGPDFYYEWGKPYIERLLDYFGSGFLHLHSNGRHLLEHVAGLEGLSGIYLIDEPWNPRAYDELDVLSKAAGEVPIIVDCRYQEFTRDLAARRLPGNVLYNVKNALTIQDANRLMEDVRAYTV